MVKIIVIFVYFVTDMHLMVKIIVIFVYFVTGMHLMVKIIVIFVYFVIGMHSMVKIIVIFVYFVRHALDGLENNLHRINDDLALKINSLNLDNRCMDVRQKLQVKPQSELERNLTLTGMQREKSAVLA
jgi:hypothetical protein